eukprot:6211734-Pleurochrysis_carterae.AAC.1
MHGALATGNARASADANGTQEIWLNVHGSLARGAIFVETFRCQDHSQAKHPPHLMRSARARDRHNLRCEHRGFCMGRRERES